MDPAAAPDVERLLAERAWVRRLAGALVRQDADADDVAQDAALAALEHAPARVERPRAWLATVVRNLVRTRARGAARRAARERTARAPLAGPATDDVVARAELVERVARLVLALDEPYRTTVLLRYFEDEPPRRVAERTGVPVETVRTRTRRALATLRARLDGERGGRGAWVPLLVGWALGDAGPADGGGGLAPLGAAGLAAKATVGGVVAVALVAAAWAVWPSRDADGVDPGHRAGPVAPATAEAGAGSEAGRLAGRTVATQDGKEGVRARGSGRVRGVVIDEAGAPVAGVEVEARAHAARSPDLLEMPAPGAPLPPGARYAVASTRGDGTFVLEGLPWGTRSEVVVVASAGRSSCEAIVTPWPGLELRAVLRVATAVAVRGRVVDRAGAGVAAWVAIEATDDGASRGPVRARWASGWVATDAAGRFALPAARPGPARVTAVVPGRGARTGLQVTLADGLDLEVSLGVPDGSAVAGRVTGDDGVPLAGVTVTVQATAPPRRPYDDLRTLRTKTDADGRYRVEGVPAGRVQEVQVVAPGFVAPPGIVGYDVPIAARGDTTVDVTLAREAAVVGRATDLEGRPLPGVAVGVAPTLAVGDLRGYRSDWTATTDADGRFRVGGLPAASAAVSAGRADLALSSAPPSVLLVAGATNEVSLVLRATATGAPVRGTVVFESGRPARGALVVAIGRTSDRFGGVAPPEVREVRTDSAGRFAFEALDPARSWELVAWQEGTTCERTGLGSGADPLRLVLREGLAVTGRVLDDRRAPLRGTKVRATAGDVLVATVDVDDDGGFAFPAPSGKALVLVVTDAAGETLGAPRAVAPGAAAGALELVVEGPLTLGGTVVRPDGRPAEGVQVTTASPRGGGYAYADARGRFRLGPMRPGTYALAVDGAEVAGAYATGRDDHRVVWVERTRRTVEVELLAPDGTPVASGLVVVHSGERVGELRSSGAGMRAVGARFVAEVEDEGLVDVRVEHVEDAAGRRVDARPTVVRDVDPTRGPVRVRLERGRSVTVRVVDEAGRPVPGATVFAGPRASLPFPPSSVSLLAPDWTGTTDDAGVHVAVGRPLDDVAVVALPPRGRYGPAVQRLAPRQDDVTLVLARGVSVAGRVDDADGAPIAGAGVRVAAAGDLEPSLRGDDGPEWARAGWTATTGADGRFSVDGVPPALAVAVTAGASPHLPATVSSVAGRTDVVVRLVVGAFVEGEIVGDGWGDREGFSVRLTLPQARPWPPVTESAEQRLPPGVRRFRVGPVVPGTYRVTVADVARIFDGLAEATVSAPRDGVVLALPVARPVRGRVVGDDVRGFSVLVRFADGATTSTTVGPAGLFDLANTRPGAVEVYAWRPGDERVGRAAATDPRAGPIEVTLGPALVLEGRVVGLPGVAGVRAAVQATGPYPVQAVAVSSDGRFRVVGLALGTTWSLSADAGTAGRAWSSPPVAAAAGARDVVLTLRPDPDDGR
ncbi:MAG: sigma-70 family RNA polymerase sigma factor [Planctomycetes bacterium]|nr:sigma-70 family RNA polymerase sigma factor [Planctomycetota bacterium]